MTAQVVECTRPLAWKSGSPFGIVAECSLQNLSLLTAAFMEGRLILDDMLELSQMISKLFIHNPVSRFNYTLGYDFKCHTMVLEQIKFWSLGLSLSEDKYKQKISINKFVETKGFSG